MNTTTSIDGQAPLAAFDSLARGHAAPAWITAGIRASWLADADGVDATLISVSENATFRVSVGGDPVMVVRLHRPGYVGDLANVVSELSWVEAVSTQTEIVTPAPIRGADGEFVQSFAGAGDSRWTAVAFEFVRGRILEEHAQLSPHFREIGRLTALLHEHARGWTPPPGFARFSWDLTDMVGPTARWGDWENAALSPTQRRLVKAAETRALSVLADMEKSERDWGLIHSDLRPSNVMIDDDRLSVIDFDDAGFGWYLYDFGSALTFYEHRPEAQTMAANWLAGYTEVAPLSTRERERAGALSLIRRLTMLGWATTHREDALPPDLWHENLPGTVEVAQRYLADPLWLVDPR